MYDASKIEFQAHKELKPSGSKRHKGSAGSNKGKKHCQGGYTTRVEPKSKGKRGKPGGKGGDQSEIPPQQTPAKK